MSHQGCRPTLGWPWAHHQGNLFWNAIIAFTDDYFPYVWTKPDQTWKDGLGPRWNLPPEDLETHLQEKHLAVNIDGPKFATDSASTHWGEFAKDVQWSFMTSHPFLSPPIGGHLKLALSSSMQLVWALPPLRLVWSS